MAEPNSQPERLDALVSRFMGKVPADVAAAPPKCGECGRPLEAAANGRLKMCQCVTTHIDAPKPLAPPVRVRDARDGDPLDVDLFPAPHNGTDTSKLAAKHAESESERIRRTIVALIEAEPDHGVTCDELEVRLNLPHQTVGPRLWELERQGRLVKTALRRRTRAGELAHAYGLAPSSGA